jgi:hypothetical protein
MDSDSQNVHCPGCKARLTGSTCRTRGGWDRSPGGDEFVDEIHCCPRCNTWWLVTFVDRYASADEIKIMGPLTEDEQSEQYERLSS